MSDNYVHSLLEMMSQKVICGGGRDGGLVQDPEHCVGELVVIGG